MVYLDIGGFKAGDRSSVFHPGAADLELELDDFKDITVSAEMTREGDRIRVHLDVSGLAHLICDRTSEPFDLEVRGTEHLFFVPSDRVEQVAGDADDVFGYEPSEPMLDITQAARDILVLAVPVRKLAPGAEDLEIPTRFGDSGQEIDPRWEGLKGLANRD